ncbi:AraC family transcriptional regulator, partial [Mesorhizobium sp. M4B.F.Ca.ET.190.01.1.1]|uniref:helix-turn-helix domain-containing protein n=1 Tax=Mesorhizobium sp. M4B.F.Ca.ET.190.01.1.1 TaxID=2563951 RepID=UPI0010934A4C
LAEAEAARETGDSEAFEELGLRIAGAAIAAAAGPSRTARTPSRRDQKRVAEAVRLIELNAERPLSLSELADGTATSPYHFLRTFRQVVGMTPYQFLLRTRLHHAAVRLRTSDEAISTIAF